MILFFRIIKIIPYSGGHLKTQKKHEIHIETHTVAGRVAKRGVVMVHYIWLFVDFGFTITIQVNDAWLRIKSFIEKMAAGNGTNLSDRIEAFCSIGFEEIAHVITRGNTYRDY